MKRFILGLVMTGMVFTVGSVLAADVTGTWTVPDAYVSEMSAMVTDKYLNTSDCEGLTVKQCFAKMVVQGGIRDTYITWKREESPEAAKATFVSARDAYKAAIRTAETAEIEFEVEAD